MAKRILDVGQCDHDHDKLRAFLTSNFGAQVDRVHLPEEAFEALRKHSYDLVLVNRKLDADYSDGVDVLRQIKADGETSAVPVMLVTNFPEHQQAAVALGALEGFGKLEYGKPETKRKLAAALGEPLEGGG